MSAVRTLAAISVAAGLGLPAVSSGCSVDAVGIEDCRKIEFARCDAGKSCGLVSDVAECKRFYRDYCLHGLSLEKSPSAGAVSACVRSLQAVQACGKGVALAECPNVTLSPTRLSQACDVLAAPEDIAECSFLVTNPQIPDASAEEASDAASDADATEQ
jgi:hypothetical protein